MCECVECKSDCVKCKSECVECKSEWMGGVVCECVSGKPGATEYVKLMNPR